MNTHLHEGRIRLCILRIDFFVETILFYLKLYLDIKNYDLEVHSERQMRASEASALKRGFVSHECFPFCHAQLYIAIRG